METLGRHLKSQCYRLRRTKVGLIHLMVPLIGILIFTSYYRSSPWSEEDKVMVFLQAIAMAFPMLIAIIIGLVYEAEEEAGNFQNLLALTCSKKRTLFLSWLMVYLLGAGACVVTVVGFCIVFEGGSTDFFKINQYLKRGIVLSLSQMSLYLITYILCFSFGRGVALGFGVFNTLLSPLLYLGLGDGIWQYIPAGYGIRLISYYELVLTEKIETVSIWQDYYVGRIIVIGITCLWLVLFLLWARRWEGGKIRED